MPLEKSKFRKYLEDKIGVTRAEFFIILSLLAMALISPIIFTQLSVGPSFLKTGEIGDTIGGITAPFINLLAAFLVFSSFRAQITANRQQMQNHKDQMNLIINEQSGDYLMRLYESISADFKKTEMAHGHNGWASALKNGIVTVQDFAGRGLSLEELKKEMHYKNGLNQIRGSVQAVKNAYHHFNLFIESSKNVLDRVNDPNIIYIVHYTCFKIENLFLSKDYNWLALQNVNGLKGLLEHRVYEDLKVTSEAAKTIKASLTDIFAKTEITMNKLLIK